jgi:DNA-binding SARP family transcriptional activator
VSLCIGVSFSRRSFVGPLDHPSAHYRSATERLPSALVLDFRILGPAEVARDGVPVPLGGTKQRATLAILLLSANRVVPIDRLADDLYAGAPPVTAVTQVQRHVSELRKLLGAEAIETRAPGYLLRVAPNCLDLERFEQWTERAAHALARGDHDAGLDQLRAALGLWRGAPLADLAYEPFAQTAIARLDELRLTAIEQRLEVELALGRHARVLPELEGLAWDHPLRERLRGLLMLALYRSGRQPEALELYRRTRESLVEEFGIEPSTSLRELERRILAQDPTLDLVSTSARGERTLLAVSSDVERLDVLTSAVAPLVVSGERSLIAAQLVADEREVAVGAAALDARRGELGPRVRTATFTSREPGRDVVRLAVNYDVELILLAGIDSGELPSIVQRAPADLALCSGPIVHWERGDGVFVPFGGGVNDWAALELGAWLASSAGVPLRLVGTASDPSRGRRDASRLLADASLAVQRVVGVAALPVLAAPRDEALREAVDPATVVVAGFPSRWPLEALEDTRLELVRAGRLPIMLVHRGTRPSGLAPRETSTRFSWSLDPA